MEIKKIVAVVPFHKRPKVSMIFWESIAFQQKHLDLQVVAVVSDEYNKQLARRYTPHVLLHPNQPLGKKWNAGVRHSAKLDYDHLLILGSDDIFSHKLMELYKREKAQYIGLMDATAMNLNTGLCRYWGGYTKQTGRHGESAGSGRLIHRDLVDKFNYILFAPVKSGLDLTMTKRLASHGIKNELVKTNFTNLRLGLKGASTISGMYGTFDRRIVVEDMENHYGSSVVNLIKQW